jgi:ABC-type glutathione transport system ATPase component
MTTLLDVRNLSVSYGTTPAVRDVSFSLAAGQVMGIAGESGSGKTTTGLALLRLLSTWNRRAGDGCARFAGRARRWCSRVR